MKEAVVGKRAPNVKKDDDGNSEDGIMKMGFRKKISEVGKVGAVIKFFFSNAGLVYACIIYAIIGLFSILKLFRTKFVFCIKTIVGNFRSTYFCCP